MTKKHQVTEKQIEILENAYKIIFEYVASKAPTGHPVINAINDMQAALVSLPYELEAERGIDGASDRARARREALWAKKDES